MAQTQLSLCSLAFIEEPKALLERANKEKSVLFLDLK